MKKILTSTKGQVMMLFAAVLPLFIGMTTMSVEVGMVYMAKNQLQVTADAAALAAVQELINDDPAGARNRALATAKANTVTGKPVGLDPNTDIEFGRWTSRGFVADPTRADAVRVTARRTAGSANGALPLFFAPMVGVNQVDITATAVAKLANVDLVLVLDKSGSMDDDTSDDGSSGAPKEPFNSMLVAAKSFVDDLKQDFDNVGVISYSDKAELNQKISRNLPRAKKKIDEIEKPKGWTHMGDGMDRALREFRSKRARTSTVKIMVLLSDGAPTCPASGKCSNNSSTVRRAKNYVRTKANEAAAADIIIHTISLGSGADRKLMRQIAQVTGGKEFFSSDGSGLRRVFEEVKKEIPVRLTQ